MNSIFRKTAKRTVNMLAFLLVAITAGTVLMVAVYCVPVSLIQKHTAESIDILKNEGDNYGFAPRISTSYPDHVTDALMLCIAATPRTGSVLFDAMNNGWMNLPPLDYKDTLISFFEEGQNDGLVINPYPRYWHGYLIWLKPMLAIMSYSDIRIMAMCFELALLVCAVYELQRRDRRLVLGFFASFMFLNPITAALSMQFASVYCITLIMTVILLRFELPSSEKCWLVFFGGGVATAFFDFFTYPVVALGIPLIIYAVLSSDQRIAHSIRDMIGHSVTFFFGYGGMWAGKWVMADLLIKSNTIKNALNQITVDSSGIEDAAVMTVPYAFRQVLMHLNHKPIKIFAVLFVLILIVMLVSRKYKIIPDKTAIILFMISLYPFIWYAVVRQHSATHARIEQREMAVTIMGIVSSVLICIKPAAIPENKDNSP